MASGIFVVCASLGWIDQPAFAQTPRQHAESAAGAAAAAEDAAKGDPGIVPGFETANPEELTRHYDEDGGALEDATLQKLADPTDGEGGEVGATILDGYVTRPDINVTREESWLSQARGVLGNPGALADDMFRTSQNPACEPTHVSSSPFEIRSCDTYGAPEDRTCGLGVEVDVLAEKTYACFRETETYRKTCAETLTARCTQILSSCKLENGLITTPNADLELSYVNFRHRAHLPDRDLGSGCHNDSRTMNLVIEDLSKLAVARLSRVVYEDGLVVRVNGVIVWSGPYGGGLADLRGDQYRIDDGSDGGRLIVGIGAGTTYLGDCTRANYDTTTVGVNILPHIVQGVNRIDFLNIVGTTGGFTADFELLMSCCGNWEETWERTCP